MIKVIYTHIYTYTHKSIPNKTYYLHNKNINTKILVTQYEPAAVANQHFPLFFSKDLQSNMKGEL